MWRPGSSGWPGWGMLAKALLYITIGLVAARGGIRSRGRTTDTQGALRLVHEHDVRTRHTAGHGGRTDRLCGVASGGGRGGPGWPGSRRKGSGPARRLGRTGALARCPSGHRSPARLWRPVGKQPAIRRGNGPRTAFDLPGGELLVWLAAASVAGYGVYQLYRSYAPKLGRQLDLSQLREPARALGRRRESLWHRRPRSRVLSHRFLSGPRRLAARCRTGGRRPRVPRHRRRASAAGRSWWWRWVWWRTASMSWSTRDTGGFGQADESTRRVSLVGELDGPCL